jgi:microcystin degradation protein MlrC
MRIGIAALWHETNTFAVEQNDRLDAKVRVGAEILDDAALYGFIGGFRKGASRPGVELVPTVEVRFTHGGLIHARVYEHYQRMIVEGLRQVGPLDAVYFALHGAMAAQDPYTDAEGELLRAARDALGAVPFVATYDFHTIMSDQEAALLAAAFPNNTNPHIDGYERGLEAARCVLRMLQGEIRPVTRRVAIPIIGPNIGQSTWSHLPEEERQLPLYQLNLVREEMERLPGVLNLTILGGYGYADTPDSCMSVLATADGDAELAERVARDLARQVWAQRERILNVRPIVSIDDGVRQAMQRPDGPIVLVDLGDDPGSASPADSPAVLESLLRLGARDAALTIRDPEVVRAAMAAGVGATLSLEVGARIDSRFYQPLPVTGVVKSLDDGEYVICGPSHGGWGREVKREAFREAHVGPRVVLRVGNKIDVIFSQRSTGKDRDFFKSAGIVMEEKKIVVVKSNQAHRASFDPIAAATIDLDTPGVSTVNYASLPYRHLRRPLWPIDREFDWEP